MNPFTRRAFTIVELLVVVTVIVVLLAITAPTLDVAIREAELVKCSANFHAIGIALHLYLGDSRQFYPVLNTWTGLLGKPTAKEEADGGRPLNIYLGYSPVKTDVPVGQCPSDLGDALAPAVNNSYRAAYATSYLPCVAPQPNKLEDTGYAGVKFIFGYSGHYGKYPETYTTAAAYYPTPNPSNKHTSLARVDNKMVIADLPWHVNRPTANEKTRWHRPQSPLRLINTSFADGHAELLDWRADIFDPSVTGDQNSWKARPYDPSWKWW